MPTTALSDIVVVSLLLDLGANVAAKDKCGATPLMQAAHRGHAQVLQLLLDSKQVRIQRPPQHSGQCHTSLRWKVQAGGVCLRKAPLKTALRQQAAATTFVNTACH